MPNVSGNECTVNFDKCWTTMPAIDSPAPTSTGFVTHCNFEILGFCCFFVAASSQANLFCVFLDNNDDCH
ncbi:hypothetical protein vseg_007952 [Gypsophila vaccaria]